MHEQKKTRKTAIHRVQRFRMKSNCIVQFANTHHQASLRNLLQETNVNCDVDYGHVLFCKLKLGRSVG